MSKHTPGPWSVCRASDTRASVRLGETHYYTAEMSMSDARLIAAAPDLLKLVKDIANLDHYCLAHGNKTLINDLRAWKLEARAAIAKAEGTS